MRTLGILLLALLLLGSPTSARAFCGFYVSGADASLYNNATQVVLMRDGTRTVLSMQNDYQGPAEDFALVVPVPVVLQEGDVVTLPREIFSRVDQLGAPRLVEYWEQDPCYRPPAPRRDRRMVRAPSSAMRSSGSAGGRPAVRVEAEFAVGEYDIVILSADDSGALEAWLRGNDYRIPEGSEPALRPYVLGGTKFFVAKVNAARATFDGNRAVLSPLRFHYDSEEFSLPVRLGLLNSGGQQDLIVNVLARRQRYEVANYRNVTIPTNIRLKDEARTRFPAFYEALFARATAGRDDVVVTEYSWNASTCDPCPSQPLTARELATLGADVLADAQASSSGPPELEGLLLKPDAIPGARLAAPSSTPARPPRRPVTPPRDFTLTRLHYRYASDGIGRDLVFRAAPGIEGGRGTPDASGAMNMEVRSSGANQFQGRYAILHPWTGRIACANPNRGVWGGPPQAGGAPNGTVPVRPMDNPLFRTGGGGAAERLVPETGFGDAIADPAPLAEVTIPDARLLADADPDVIPVTDQRAAVEMVRLAQEAEAAAQARASEGEASGEGGGQGAEGPPEVAASGGCAGCAAATGAGPWGAGAATLALLALVFHRRRRR